MTKRLISAFAAALIALLPSAALADSRIISKDGKRLDVELHCGNIIEAMELEKGKQIKLDSSMLSQKCSMAVVGSRQGFIRLNDNATYEVEDSELVRTK